MLFRKIDTFARASSSRCTSFELLGLCVLQSIFALSGCYATAETTDTFQNKQASQDTQATLANLAQRGSCTAYSWASCRPSAQNWDCSTIGTPRPARNIEYSVGDTSMHTYTGKKGTFRQDEALFTLTLETDETNPLTDWKSNQCAIGCSLEARAALHIPHQRDDLKSWRTGVKELFAGQQLCGFLDDNKKCSNPERRVRLTATNGIRVIASTAGLSGGTPQGNTNAEDAGNPKTPIIYVKYIALSPSSVPNRVIQVFFSEATQAGPPMAQLALHGCNLTSDPTTN